MTKPHSKKTISKAYVGANTSRVEPEGWNPYVKHSNDERDYIQIKANQVFPENWYYRKSEDGKRFERFQITKWQIENRPIYTQWFREETVRLAKAGRIFTKR